MVQGYGNSVNKQEGYGSHERFSNVRHQDLAASAQCRDNGLLGRFKGHSGTVRESSSLATKSWKINIYG